MHNETPRLVGTDGEKHNSPAHFGAVAAMAIRTDFGFISRIGGTAHM